MKKLLLVLSVLLLSSWGKIGHRTVGEIAQRQLSFTAEQKINEILDGQSLAVASTWADEMRSNPEFDKYSTWHYVNLPLDKEYGDVEHLGPNVVKMINTAIPILKSPSADKKTKQFWLKYLVHMVGDIHQPLHTGRAEDYGGSKIKVNFKGRKGADNQTNLHVLWDTDMIDDYKMSYTEYATKLQNQFKDTLVEQGNATKWANESHEYVSKIYETENGSYLSYDYVYENLPIVDERLYFAGIRLGNLLNNIFGE
jgi:hypothetical protein